MTTEKDRKEDKEKTTRTPKETTSTSEEFGKKQHDGENGDEIL